MTKIRQRKKVKSASNWDIFKATTAKFQPKYIFKVKYMEKLNNSGYMQIIRSWWFVKFFIEEYPLGIPSRSKRAVTKLSPKLMSALSSIRHHLASPRTSPTINQSKERLPWSPVTRQLATGLLYVIRDLVFKVVREKNQKLGSCEPAAPPFHHITESSCCLNSWQVVDENEL